MSAIALMVPDDDGRDLSKLSIDELKKALADCLRITVTGLRNAAAIVKELENRGEDLSKLKYSLMNYLRRIAHGQVLPEVVVRFAGKPGLLNIVAALPTPDQERLAAGDPVLMVTTAPDGKFTHRMEDPLELKPRQISLVFGRGFIRPETEQIAWIEADRMQASKPIPKSIGDLSLDKDRGGVVVGRKFIPLADLAAAVKALRS